MSRELIQWIITLAIEQGVPLAREVIKLFQVDAPTLAQFDKIFSLVKSPAQYLLEARERLGVEKPPGSPL